MTTYLFYLCKVTQENQRRDSAKGGLNPVRSALGWSGTGVVSDTEEGSGPEIIDLEETLMIRTVILFLFHIYLLFL